MSKTLVVAVPQGSGYGASELKIVIQKYTVRSFVYTMLGILLIFLISWGITALQKSAKKAPKLAPIAKMELVDIPPAVEDAAPQPPPPPQMITSGPAARAGTPVPIPDADLRPDLQDFADIDVMNRASSVGGDGLDLGGFSSNIDFDRRDIKVDTREEEPDPDEFIAVEQDPQIDLAQLQKMVKYPEKAIRAGIEGRVTIRALISKEGKVLKTMIDQSDSPLLNQAAIDAINNYGYIPPAIQNKQPVTVWLSVPINFRLR